MQIQCLLVRAGSRRVAIPVDAIEHVGEFVVSPPPPLSEPWIGGLGRHSQGIFALVAMGGAERPEGLATRKCALIKRQRTRWQWGLEIDDVGRIVALTPSTARASSDESSRGATESAIEAQDANGQSFELLDVDWIQACLAGSKATG